MSALRSTWLGLCSAARRAGGPLRAPAAMASAAAAQPRRTFLTTPAMRQAAAASFATPQDRLRNVAIIAHVDHGKTTLVDKLLAACNETLTGERVMDSNPLETERGITILAKCTSVNYKDHVINIVDTPGHADFGGEVERILGMVDCVILLVDATEGPMTQTKFVLGKALKQNMRPIVLLNKVDRDTARIQEAENEIFELFALLGASNEQLDFPTMYASGRQGWAVRKMDDKRESMVPLLDMIIEHVPAPKARSDEQFTMLVTIIQREAFLGRIVTGRIVSGTLRVGDPVHCMSRTGAELEAGKITKILKRRGVSRDELAVAYAGDIVTIAGLTKPTVTDTIASPEVLAPLPAHPIDPPTVTMTFNVNDSPFSGKSGNKLTSLQIGERLRAEAETNVSIRLIEKQGESFEVQGRGEMQLGVLIENMRREGYELGVSPPNVVYLEDANGKKLEPLEEVNIEVDDAYTGIVIEKLSVRKGELKGMVPQAGGKTKLHFSIPSRGLMGYRAIFMVDTHGTGVMNRVFDSYVPYRGNFEKNRKGALTSMDNGVVTSYALQLLEPRGVLFVGPGTEVYEGMIVGEHSRDNDLDVNPVRTKKLTNVRTHSHDDIVKLVPPREFTLEEALGYVGSDELVECTPAAVRFRKRILDTDRRKSKVRSNND